MARRTPRQPTATHPNPATSAPAPATDGSLEPLAPPPATIVRTHRSRRLIALAVATIALCAALGWWAFRQATHTITVVAARTTIHAGQVIGATDLGTVNINAGSGLSTIPADQMDTLIGKRAQTDLPAGGVVPEGSAAATSVPSKGTAQVGLAVKPGMAPASNLTIGSPVRVVFLPANNAAASTPVAAPVAGTVDQVSRAIDGSTTTIDVLVPADVAPDIAAASAQNRIAVVLDTKDR